LKFQRLHWRLMLQAGEHSCLLAGILLILACAPLASCARHAVRVPVSQEDLIRANEAVQEGDKAFSKSEDYPALIKYLEASRLNPNSEYVFNKLGMAYARLKFYREATAAFLQSIALNSKYEYAFNNLGSVYFAQRDNKKAEKYFLKAIRLSGKVASFHVNLGTLYFETKKYNAAMAEFHQAMQFDPDILKSAQGVNLSAEVVTGGGDFRKHYLMARLYASTGDAVRAVESLQKALAGGFTDLDSIEKEPDFNPIRQDKGFIELMRKAQLGFRIQ
jgi:protein O-mannosyl-transferase